MPRDDAGADYGLIAYFLVLLGAIFIGPLEAVLGLAAYWLLTDEDPTQRANVAGRAERRKYHSLFDTRSPAQRYSTAVSVRTGW